MAAGLSAVVSAWLWPCLPGCGLWAGKEFPVRRAYVRRPLAIDSLPVSRRPGHAMAGDYAIFFPRTGSLFAGESYARGSRDVATVKVWAALGGSAFSPAATSASRARAGNDFDPVRFMMAAR